MPKHLLRRRKGTELSLIQFLRWVLLSFDNEIVTMASARDDPRIDIVCMWSQSCVQFVPKLFPVCPKVVSSLSQSYFQFVSKLGQKLSCCQKVVSKFSKVESRLSQSCPKPISLLTQCCPEIVSKLFKRSPKAVLKFMSQGCPKVVSKLSQGCL